MLVDKMGDAQLIVGRTSCEGCQARQIAQVKCGACSLVRCFGCDLFCPKCKPQKGAA